MKSEEIQAEWDAFIEYPEGSGKLHVTTHSALIFARIIAQMAEERERDKLRTQLHHAQMAAEAEAKEVDERNAVIDRLRTQNRALVEALESQKNEWLSWHEKRTSLEKDAKRYRYLREYSPGIILEDIMGCEAERHPQAELDRAIDKAITQAEGGV